MANEIKSELSAAPNSSIVETTIGYFATERQARQFFSYLQRSIVELSADAAALLARVEPSVIDDNRQDQPELANVRYRLDIPTAVAERLKDDGVEDHVLLYIVRTWCAGFISGDITGNYKRR